MECKTKMITKKINQTVCVAGLAALVAVSAGCRANKLSLLSDRNIIPPPYKSPQLTQNAPATAGRSEMPAVIVTPPVVPPSDNAQPVLPGDNASPIFVAAGPQDATTQTHIDTPEDFSPKTGSTAKPAAPKGAPATPPQPKRTYTVAKGDTLSDIAYMYMISWRDLAAENNLTEKSVLKVNQKLTLPPNAAKTPRPRQQHKAAPKATPKGTAPAAAPRASTPKHPVPADGIYTIVANDNLWDIAKKFGLKSEDIKAVNPNVNWDRLQIGQKIILPTGKTASAQPKQAAAPAPKPAENKATVAPPPPLPKMPENAPEPPMPNLVPAETKPAPPPPALIQPNAAPAQVVPTVPAPQEFPPEPPKPITPQLSRSRKLTVVFA